VRLLSSHSHPKQESQVVSNKTTGLKIPKPTLQPQENITQAQVTHLLNIFIPACNFLLADKMHDADSADVGGKNDGGARMAIENTVINVCSRLDTMLAEEPRWSLANHESLEDAFKQVYTQHARMLAEQANAYAEINSPHHNLKPTLVKIPEGSWVAFLGDLSHIEDAIVGVGSCPAHAIEAFDAMFAGEVPENLQAWLASRGVTLNKTEAEQKTNEQTKIVDENRTEHPPGPTKQRTNKPRNRKHPGTDGAVGGKQNPL